MNERVQLALSYYLERMPYQEIAERCGFASKKEARAAIRQELAKQVTQNTDEVRLQQLAILDALHQRIWPLFCEKKPDIQVAQCLLAISEQRARLLGLDVPTSNNVTANIPVVREVPSGYLSEAKDA